MSRMRREIVMLCERWEDARKMIRQVLRSRLVSRRLQTAKQPRHCWRLQPRGSPRGPWRTGPALAYAFRLPTSIRAVFRDAGKRFCGTERNRRIRTSMSGWCDWGERATAPPYADFCGKAVCQESNSILTTRIVLLPVSRLPNTLTV